MFDRRIAIPASLLVMTACLPPARPNVVAPKRGPEARITASWTGGYTGRTAQALFSVEKGAYVVVGHLGGDGVIRILFPSSPRERGAVDAKRTYRTPTVHAVHDGLPELYTLGPRPFRNIDVRLDSYDGNGFGFFFLVASRFPFNFSELHEAWEFDEIDVPDYFMYGSDPRRAIKALADFMADGAPYTLEFASSFGSVNMSTAMDTRLDCLTFTTMGIGSLLGWYWYSPFSSMHARSQSPLGACGSGLRYAFGLNYYNNYYGYSPVPPVTINPNPAPPTPERRTMPRPGYRQPGQARRAIDFTDPTWSRRADVGGRRATASGDRLRADELRRRPSSSAARRFDSPRHDAPRHESPRAERPRSESPRADSPRPSPHIERPSVSRPAETSRPTPTPQPSSSSGASAPVRSDDGKKPPR